MRLRSPQLLAAFMHANDASQARLARSVGCSRQFIHLLLRGQRTTCTIEVAQRIEAALRVIPGTLFVRTLSPQRRRSDQEPVLMSRDMLRYLDATTPPRTSAAPSAGSGDLAEQTHE